MALYAGCGDQSSERRGGGGIPDLTAGSASTAGAGSAADGGAAGELATGAPVAWCEAYEVINCSCQQCHRSPLRNGAPMPLLTYEDTQAPFPVATSANKVWQDMQQIVSTGFMPPVGDSSAQPAVQALTARQKSTLLTWLEEGARPEGGTSCPEACDWSDNTPEP